jgi:hypothetical protein
LKKNCSALEKEMDKVLRVKKHDPEFMIGVAELEKSVKYFCSNWCFKGYDTVSTLEKMKEFCIQNDLIFSPTCSNSPRGRNRNSPLDSMFNFHRGIYEPEVPLGHTRRISASLEINSPIVLRYDGHGRIEICITKYGTLEMIKKSWTEIEKIRDYCLGKSPRNRKDFGLNWDLAIMCAKAAKKSKSPFKDVARAIVQNSRMREKFVEPIILQQLMETLKKNKEEEKTGVVRSGEYQNVYPSKLGSTLSDARDSLSKLQNECALADLKNAEEYYYNDSEPKEPKAVLIRIIRYRVETLKKDMKEMGHKLPFLDSI